jgi:predicted transposase YbfD/YdcC
LAALQASAEMYHPNGIHQKCEQNRGRTEHRRLSMWTTFSGIDTQRWAGVQTIIKLERWGIRKGKEYSHVHWFMTSVKAMPDILATIIRLHWELENNGHWVKDVIFEEDKTPTKNSTANAVLALLRNMVINVYRRSGHYSITHAIERFTNIIKELFELLRT